MSRSAYPGILGLHPEQMLDGGSFFQQQLGVWRHQTSDLPSTLPQKCSPAASFFPDRKNVRTVLKTPGISI